MKKRCIIHFGMHKTGSSSIQQTLFNNLNNLIDVYYLHCGIPNSSIPVVTAFGDNPEKYFWNLRSGLSEEQVMERAKVIKAQLAAQLETTSQADALLSGEDISRLSRSALARLVAWLAERVEVVEAVGYIRPPALFMASKFQQDIRGDRIPADWSSLIPCYQQQFEVFDQVLGRERVQFWKYDPANFPGGCVVRDFCDRLGIKIPQGRVVRKNDGVSRNALALVYAYRKFRPVDHRLNFQPLYRLFSNLPGPKLQFSTRRINEALALRRDDIAWMENRLNASLYEPPIDHPDAIDDEADLFCFNPESVAWLQAQLNAKGILLQLPARAPDPEQIAEGIHRLALQFQEEARIKSEKIGRRAALSNGKASG